MAALLGHGYERAHPAAMHPFFNTDARETFQTRPENNTFYGLDGANDMSRNNHFTQSKIDSQITTKSSSTHLDLLTKQTSSHPLNHQPVGSASSIDIDPASSRRKRRKVTPSKIPQSAFIEQEDGSRADEPTVTIDDANGTTGTGNARLVSVQVPKIDRGQQEITASPSSTALQTPKKRRARKVQVKQDVETSQHIGDPSGSKAAGNPVLPKPRRSTPKKKTMALHTNGKLLSSPVTDLSPVKEGTTTDDKRPASSRNFKMKNGKFVQSFEVVLKYGHDQKSREDTGKKIDALLVRPNGMIQPNEGQGLSKTHPFFLGKVKPKLQASEQFPGHGDKSDNEADPTSRQREPVAWKDIKFNSPKPVFFKSTETTEPVWPPLSIQHVGKQFPDNHRHVSIENNSVKAKFKSRIVHLTDEENVLQQYADQLGANLTSTHNITVPQKQHLSGGQVAQHLDAISFTHCVHEAISSTRSKLISGSSAFDRGECAGPNAWTSQFAPAYASQVLQPSATVLHKWLQGLAIHNVKSGIDTNENIKKSKTQIKKKRRKLKDDFDNFIVDTDDEQEDSKTTKTAILITGPHGCGKTASVYAVAKELGFEVFEIHPGMRRSAKDIYDKVGDMAHNHLVQKSSEFSRSSSVALSDSETLPAREKDRKQTSLACSLGTKTIDAKSSDQQVLPKAKKEQKQSLILFEEVDLLFDEDKGFWSGVQSLIMNSKRPVVLTCNDLTSIPLGDLNLYDVLTYNSIEQRIATDYLAYLTAAEGHIVDQEALAGLYLSKNKDLRASITELNLWCQMTVGSQHGGLDWMDRNLPNQAQTNDSGERLRIFSRNTFQKSLDLMPQLDIEGEDAIRFNQETLGIDVSAWCDPVGIIIHDQIDSSSTKLQTISQISDVIEARSVVDLLDEFAAPAVSYAAAKLGQIQSRASNRDFVTAHYMKKLVQDIPHKKKLVEALEPIMNEKPTFPPSQGRLAPSIDAATTNIATDIAPYVRCIVSFDKRLEERRDEIFGSQGKTRKTRAARAAAEGGDKSSTRSERWFPKDLDFDKVLRSGGIWPGWHEELRHQSPGADVVSSPNSPAT